MAYSRFKLLLQIPFGFVGPLPKNCVLLTLCRMLTSREDKHIQLYLWLTWYLASFLKMGILPENEKNTHGCFLYSERGKLDLMFWTVGLIVLIFSLHGGPMIWTLKTSRPKIFIISVAGEGWNVGERSVFGGMPLEGISDAQSPALRQHQRRFFVQWMLVNAETHKQSKFRM